MLNILEVCVPKLGINLAALGPSDPMYWHLHGRGEEAGLLRSAGAERRSEVRAGAGRASCCRSRYAATLCGKIDPNVASKPGVTGGTDGGTIYLTTADRWGNMVSLIHSVFSVYGSRATVAPYGFVLHNRGSAFSLDPKSPNIVAPHKRPFHTIIAGFVMKDGQPLMTFGNMGGSVQPETHAQHMVNLIDLGMNVQMTTDAARFTHNQNSQRAVARDQPVQPGRRGAEGEGTRRARRSTADRSAAIRASCSRAIRACPSRPSTRAAVTRRSAGERRLSRRIGSSQGRPGGRLVIYSQRKTFAESAMQTTKTTASAATSPRCADHASPFQMPCSSDTA